MEAKDKAIIFGIIFLLALSGCIQEPQTKKASDYFKDLAEDIHSEINDSLQEAKADLPHYSTEGLSGETLERMELLQRFYYSMIEDLEWIAGKENKTFQEMQSEKSIEELEELAREETSYFIAWKLLLEANAFAVQEREEHLHSVDLKIAEAEALVGKITANTEAKVIQGAFTESQLKEDFVGDKAREIIASFIEFREQKLLEKSEAMERYSDAIKLIELKALLES